MNIVVFVVDDTILLYCLSCHLRLQYALCPLFLPDFEQPQVHSYIDLKEYEYHQNTITETFLVFASLTTL